MAAATSSDMQKIVVLDRDGVINLDSDDYIKSPDEWIPIPGSLEAIARLKKAGYKVAIATNQSGVGRGLFNLTTLHATHEKMRLCLAEHDAQIDFIAFCPHSPADQCDCRKPLPGLLYGIEDALGVDLTGSPFIGDSLRDLDAAVAKNMIPFLVKTGKGENTAVKGNLPPKTRTFDDLGSAVEFLLSIDSVDPV